MVESRFLKVFEHVIAVSNRSIDLKAINVSTNAIGVESYHYYMCNL